jgi:hypothetical protein
MVGMFLNMITFLLTTYFYYTSLKPKLSYEILSDSSKYVDYMKQNYIGLAIYFLLIVVVQFFINTYAITSNCGGVMTENLTAAALLTFIPWTLMFGAVIVVLTVFPGFKGAFSDVVGYYYVSKNANDLLTDLLLNKKLDNAMNGDNGKNKTNGVNNSTTNVNTKQTGGNATTSDISDVSNSDPEPASTNGKSNMQRLEDAADAIVKICGNTSILINQIVPSNFAKYWNILDPLMKPKYRNNSPEGIGMRVSLFELCVTRDDIGEALWFIYTGVLICSVIQMKIANRGCESDLQTMEQKYQAYKQEEQAEIDAKSKLNETDYTITN